MAYRDEIISLEDNSNKPKKVYPKECWPIVTNRRNKGKLYKVPFTYGVDNIVGNSTVMNQSGNHSSNSILKKNDFNGNNSMNNSHQKKQKSVAFKMTVELSPDCNCEAPQENVQSKAENRNAASSSSAVTNKKKTEGKEPNKE